MRGGLQCGEGDYIRSERSSYVAQSESICLHVMSREKLQYRHKLYIIHRETNPGQGNQSQVTERQQRAAAVMSYYRADFKSREEP